MSKYQFEINLLNEVEKNIHDILIEKIDLLETREALMCLSKKIEEFKCSSTNSNKDNNNKYSTSISSRSNLEYPELML